MLTDLWLLAGILTARPNLPSSLLAQQSQTLVQPQVIRSLPGGLDSVPVFNSNSPELIQSEGILLSTFPPQGKAVPAAHLNYAFSGRFDLFDHHVVRAQSATDTRTVYIGVIVHNPGRQAVTLTLREAVSYLGQEAPWQEQAAVSANLLGTHFSGPGSRLMNDILRDRRQPQWPAQVEIAAGESYLLMNVPVPLRRLAVATDGTLAPGSALLPPPQRQTGNSRTSADWSNRINARSTLMRLNSDGPVYVASLSMAAPTTADGGERVPTLTEWKALLFQAGLAGERDRRPTSPRDARAADPFIYGRVGGVAQGSRWIATLTDPNHPDQLTIPLPEEPISYVLSTVDRNTFGTGQVQSAPMLARYPDTAYRAHGNYGVEYSLALPLYNPTSESKTVSLSIQTPLQNETLRDALSFLKVATAHVFFRGTVLFLYEDDTGRARANYLHLVQHQGEAGEPLVQLNLFPQSRRRVDVQFLYPPDATPPQVLTLTTEAQ